MNSTENKDKSAFSFAGNGVNQKGLTKREYFAIEAMQALIANPNIKRPEKTATLKQDLKEFSRIAVEYADSLLRELANES